MTVSLVDFPVLTLGIYGVNVSTGAQVKLGSVPLPDPTTRLQTIEGILAYISQCHKQEDLCTIANVSFDPCAFDYFTVLDINKETEQ